MNGIRLVFEGGGIKGIASAGVLDELISNEVPVHGCAGSSAGAILAGLWGMGYHPAMILEIMENTDFSDFMDDRVGIVRDVMALVNGFGFYPGNVIRDWLWSMIKRRHGRFFERDVTIGQMRERTGREIRIVGCSLKTRKTQVFGDDVSLIEAIRASMAVPIVFEPVTINGEMFVDGGCLANLPINVWGSLSGVVGVRLDNLPDSRSGVHPPDSLVDYVSSVVGMIYDGAQPDTTGLERQIIPVNTMGVGTLDFDISRELKGRLVESGRQSARSWLENRSSL